MTQNQFYVLKNIFKISKILTTTLQGIYDTRNVIMDVMKNAEDRLQVEMAKGDYLIEAHYMKEEEEIGCQYVEFQLDVLSKRRKGRK